MPSRRTLNKLNHINELDLTYKMKISGLVKLYHRNFNDNDIYYVVINDGFKKHEDYYNLFHVDIVGLKSFMNEEKTIGQLAEESRAIFYLTITDGVENIRRINYEQFCEDPFFYDINTNGLKEMIREEELKDLLSI